MRDIRATLKKSTMAFGYNFAAYNSLLHFLLGSVIIVIYFIYIRLKLVDKPPLRH